MRQSGLGATLGIEPWNLSRVTHSGSTTGAVLTGVESTAVCWVWVVVVVVVVLPSTNWLLFLLLLLVPFT